MIHLFTCKEKITIIDDNQTGAALVLTLSIITLVILFIMMLFQQITNTTTQIVTMEKNIDAKHIAEMGIDYYQYHIESVSDDLQQAFNSGGIILLLSEINGINNNLRGIKEIDGDNRYFELVLPSTTYAEQSGDIIITFTSIGTAFGKTVEETNTVTINID